MANDITELRLTALEITCNMLMDQNRLMQEQVARNESELKRLTEVLDSIGGSLAHIERLMLTLHEEDFNGH